MRNKVVCEAVASGEAGDISYLKNIAVCEAGQIKEAFSRCKIVSEYLADFGEVKINNNIVAYIVGDWAEGNKLLHLFIIKGSLYEEYIFVIDGNEADINIQGSSIEIVLGGFSEVYKIRGLNVIRIELNNGILSYYDLGDFINILTPDNSIKYIDTNMRLDSIDGLSGKEEESLEKEAYYKGSAYSEHEIVRQAVKNMLLKDNNLQLKSSNKTSIVIEDNNFRYTILINSKDVLGNVIEISLIS